MFKEFKEFITRGNVVDLAVAVVIGTAFTALVHSFVNDVLMQIVAAVVDTPDFNDVSIRINDTDILYGRFITALLTFVIVAFAVFLVVKAINTLQNLRRTEDLEEAQITEVELLTEIRDTLRAQSNG